MTNGLSVSKNLTEWQSLTDEQKKARIAQVNARFAQSDTFKIQERIRLSGIPKKYQKAQLTPSTETLLGKLKTHEISGVLFQGKTGRGKTYASCAMLMSHLQTDLGKFATMNDILNRVRSAYSSGESPDEIFGRYRGTKLLVIDDLGKENVSPDSIMRIFELLDTRINNELPTIITTQFTNNELLQRYSNKVNDREMASAVLSRLTEFMPIVFHGEDRRAR